MEMVYLYMFILIVGFISEVSMETCPAGDVSPCQCSEYADWVEDDTIKVDCGCCAYRKMHDLQTLQNVSRSLSGKKDVLLILDYFMINKRLSKLLSGIGIYWLEFQNCRVDRFTNEDQPGSIDLAALENDLKGLVIYNSSTVQPKLNLGHLKKLRELQLFGNDITELRDDWLGSGLSSLESVFIEKNLLFSIGRNAFSQLTNLKFLSLRDNRLVHIQRSMFPTRADKLLRLSLEKNAITELPRDLFIRMPSIKSVRLSKNKISTLDKHTWSPIWQQLKVLKLNDNNITCDDRLNWIIESKKIPRSFYGKCSYPYEFRGMHLVEFLESRRQ